MLFKTISMKSANGAESSVDSAILRDIEVKVVIKCENGVDSGVDSAGVESGADSAIDSASGEKFGAESSEIIITFFALQNDLEELVCGYLSTFNLKADLFRENNIFYANLPLSKETILSHLAQKDFIQSCEQIALSDKKILRDSIIMPFNGSRAIIESKFLEENRAFFAESSAESSVDFLDSAFCVRIFTNLSQSNLAQSFDSNPKNAIYKAFGKALQKCNDLLDSAIFLNFCIDLECLKILLLQKCTFIICKKLPPFSVVKFAQKFGATLICFHQNQFFATTHQMRLK